MADNSSEFGIGRGRTGYGRDLRHYEEHRLQMSVNPADPDDTMDAVLARELEMEKRDRNVDDGFVIG